MLGEACRLLKILSFYKNDLYFLPDDYFDMCLVLEEIVLDSNHLLSIPAIPISLSQSLVKLHLGNNQISSCGSLCTTKLAGLKQFGVSSRILNHYYSVLLHNHI